MHQPRTEVISLATTDGQRVRILRTDACKLRTRAAAASPSRRSTSSIHSASTEGLGIEVSAWVAMSAMIPDDVVL
ncbi:hypothetical protein [Streptomyces plumbiresistens]|uniref:hypothetical protein n=1 Tax=Streptomyces plumbiresistens TaxID=511811 RepID=UPI0031E5FD53